MIGYGVVATRLIPRGTITWVADGLDHVFTTAQIEDIAPMLRPLVEKYSWTNGKGQSILCWDHARFINHSCEASCLSAGFDFEIAVRDIFPGEELTDDYGTLNLSEPFQCLCDSPQCRDVVRPDDFLKYGAEWDRIVSAAFPLIRTLEQPLWLLVAEKPEVEKVLSGAAPLPSCMVHYRRSGM
ncbi:MAG TPA: SET domain-containing protein-lysine N-methyltransferase [Terriglobia bacterium]|nr:SET domain-containing protein-lysine N-methyltransferase [Terriglobia bacterium]